MSLSRADSNKSPSFGRASPPGLRSRASSFGSHNSGLSYPPRRRSPGAGRTPAKKPVTISYNRVTRQKGNVVEKKVGRRKGPLRPEHRKQASEIRKLRACLRCKFLKKTCDKGDPCAGCQPSHARLWQVPCTRIDIKDLGYFLEGFSADCQPKQSFAPSVSDIKGYGDKETLIWVSHGYGLALPVAARKIFFTDTHVLPVSWVEVTTGRGTGPLEFETPTDEFTVGEKGISRHVLSEYVEKYIDGSFEEFVDEYYGYTPFITEILKTIHRFYVKEKTSIIRKALKLLVAYNLTTSITTVEATGNVDFENLFDDDESRFYGRVVAPVMINQEVKLGLAEVWRELHKDVLEELSSFFSAVYSGDKLKYWHYIFTMSSILLIIWEQMQFDSHYRILEPATVDKFCGDMEATPVGVIVGLFQAISQKLPDFIEWDTRRHGHLLNNNIAICEALTEVRQHVTKHGKHLPSLQSLL